MERQQERDSAGTEPLSTELIEERLREAERRGAQVGEIAQEVFDPVLFRREFPALGQEVHPGKPLVYLDSAATALKPWPVVLAVASYDAHYPANVHRGLHVLSERATEAYEGARAKVAQFLGASDLQEVVFTRGTTEALNLVAHSWGRAHLKPGDEVLLSVLEHHSNLVPWQMLAQETGVVLKFAELSEDGRLEVASVVRALTPRTRVVAITGMSNVLGTVPPVAEVARVAHEQGAVVVVDGAQSVPHGPTDVRTLGADFLAFSGHKLFGPTGIGVLYGRRELLESTPPMLGGGSMVLRVGLTESSWNEPPWKFEAGTPPIGEAIGLGAAIDFLNRYSWDELRAHEERLIHQAHRVLDELPGFRRYGPDAEHKGAIVAFTVDGIHPHDLAQLVDREGVAIRAGHHCAMPLHKRLEVNASARASLSYYNSLEDIEVLANAIDAARKIFRAP